jgi:hypothetical protein
MQQSGQPGEFWLWRAKPETTVSTPQVTQEFAMGITQKQKHTLFAGAVLTSAAFAVMFLVSHHVSAEGKPADTAADDAMKMFNDGRQIFRFDTFGDEEFWGGSSNCIRPFKAAGPGV